MREEFFRQFSPLGLLECPIKAQQPSAPLQTVTGHFQLVHRVDVLDVKFDAWTIRSFRSPHVQIFVSACFEIQCVVAIVEVSQFWEKSELILRIQLRVCKPLFSERDTGCEVHRIRTLFYVRE